MYLYPFLLYAHAVLQFKSSGHEFWNSPALAEEEKIALRSAVGNDNERSFYVMSNWIRSTIASSTDSLHSPLSDNKEMKLYDILSDFTKAYNDIMQSVDAGMPFPLVQMGRTFVFVYVFLLPWVMVNDDVGPVWLCLYCFMMTYAFLGLEMVSDEIQDPFGDDPNDFNILDLAERCFKDIAVLIEDIDGESSADKLRSYCALLTTEAGKSCEEDYSMRAGPKFSINVDNKRSHLLKTASAQSLISKNLKSTRSLSSSEPDSSVPYSPPFHLPDPV